MPGWQPFVPSSDLSKCEAAAIAVASRVLAIPVKRTERKLIGYLTRPEIDALLSAADRTTWDGRRDHALLLTLYNSGARVSEIIGVRYDEIVLSAPASLKLHGKGRKERAVPLWAKTAQVRRAWFQELGATDSAVWHFPAHVDTVFPATALPFC
jgi:integrase/recombinase XerD